MLTIITKVFLFWQLAHYCFRSLGSNSMPFSIIAVINIESFYVHEFSNATCKYYLVPARFIINTTDEGGRYYDNNDGQKNWS